MPKQRKKTEIDFGDEEAVLADVATALETDVEELRDRRRPGMSGFGEGTIYLVAGRARGVQRRQEPRPGVRTGGGGREAGPRARAWNCSTRTSSRAHINTDKLRDELRGDALNARIDDLTDEARTGS